MSPCQLRLLNRDLSQRQKSRKKDSALPAEQRPRYQNRNIATFAVKSFETKALASLHEEVPCGK